MDDIDRKKLVESAKLDFTDYLKLVVIVRSENPSWRKGQTYFNVLHDVRPDLAELIRGTSIDPFYRECNFAEFMYRLSIMWLKG